MKINKKVIKREKEKEKKLVELGFKPVSKQEKIKRLRGLIRII